MVLVLTGWTVDFDGFENADTTASVVTVVTGDFVFPLMLQD